MPPGCEPALQPTCRQILPFRISYLFILRAFKVWPPAGRKQETNQGQEWQNSILAQLVMATGGAERQGQGL